ncbi:ABC transporter ATP-binding protein [Corynebacterium sp.]|uniref:ABC transporter ATP-binding protein n=1 Tax=Corynebacterium sp. TaxID=1720 RepID=UPI0026DC2304|nr:ABC transporter ATP-binding protein [Corynebacterium sp.]MDO5031629.1 ABC transporter ATP-binding protein [Corynebacterium sp.]
MRFPTATWPEVRGVVSTVVRTVPRARGWTVLSVLLLVLGAVGNVVVPILLGRIVDAVLSPAGSAARLGALGGGLAAAAVVSACASAAGFYALSKVTERVIAGMREEMVGTALGLPVHRVEEAGTGDLVSRSTDDVAELSSAVTTTVPALSSSIFAIGTTAVALVGLQWQFLAVVVAAAPLYVIASRNYLKVAPERYSTERAAMAERARRVLEAIHGRDTVRAFGMEQQMHDSINESSLAVSHAGYRARRTLMVLQAWVSVVECLMLVVGLIVGFYAVRAGALSVGAVTAAMLMLIRLRGPMRSLMMVLDTIQSGYASLARIAGVVKDPPAPVPPAGAPDPTGEVCLDGVSFAYGPAGGAGDGQRWAVRDVCLHAEPGEVIALVGASGAGKSTVAALLAGLRVPDSGTVTIDGVEVRLLSDVERGQRLALISQEVHVFSGTLRADLSLACPDATDAQMKQALARVHADWFERMADGLDTVVGARGQQLDPVEAQQLALARILLLDPAVVVMDEATAEAGSAGAGALEAAAAEVTAGRTAIIVAHRLDQAAQSDEVLVMDQGRVVERGTHEELLHSKGRYSHMWNAWQKGRD